MASSAKLLNDGEWVGVSTRADVESRERVSDIGTQGRAALPDIPRAEDRTAGAHPWRTGRRRSA